VKPAETPVQKPPAAAPALVIDDRGGGAPATDWRFFTDAVMGGVSGGAMSVESVAGRAALCLRGRVRLDNNGGFIQMALDLPAVAGEWRGIEIDVLGNGRRYGLHLRTAGMTWPWQSYRTSFEAAPAWRTLLLPFDEFVPYRFSGALQAGDLRRVGLLAIGEAFEAELALGRLALYR